MRSWRTSYPWPLCVDYGESSVIGDRSLGRDPRVVALLAKSVMQGLAQSGMAHCGKHFPGYAAAVEDPHHSFPVIERSRAEMEANELAVFRHFAPLVDSMMIGHIHYGSLDPEMRPASLSPAMINGLLRHEMGFGGLVMTDDLDMGAIIDTTSFQDMLALALAAGNDLLMICHRVDMLDEARAVLETRSQHGSEPDFAAPPG